MKRLASVLSLLVLGVVVSSCAVGGPKPTTAITDTSATLNGDVYSNFAGDTTYFWRYGQTIPYANETTHRAVAISDDQAHPVSEPLAGLTPGTTYHFQLCASDLQENPPRVNCSKDQTFTSDTAVLTLSEDCSAYPPFHGGRWTLSGFPPNTLYTFKVDASGSLSDGQNITDENGDDTLAVFALSAGVFKVTIDWAGGTREKTLFVDCGSGNG